MTTAVHLIFELLFTLIL